MQPLLASGLLVLVLIGGAACLNVTLGVMLPLSYTFLPQAVELAVSEINADPTFLPGITLEIDLKDDGDQSQALIDAAVLASECPCRDPPPVVGVIGNAFSATSTVTQLLFKKFKIPQLSPTATDPSLSDKSLYPFFMRLIPTDAHQTTVMVKLIQSYGWTKVALFTTQDAYGSGGQSAFIANANAVGISILTVGSAQAVVSQDLSQQLDALAASQARVVVLFGDYFVPDFMLQAQARGLTGPDYVYITSEAVLIELAGGQVANPQAALKALYGSFSINPSAGEGPRFDQMKASWLATGHSLQDLVAFTVLCYDTVYVYANAFQRMLADGQSIFNGTALLQYMLKSNFTGALGPISFDANGDILGNYDIINYQDPNGGNQTQQTIAHYQVSSLIPLSNAVFASGTSTVPSDAPPPSPTTNYALRWGLIAMGIALFLLLVALLIFIIFRRYYYLVVLPKHEQQSDNWDK